MITFKRLKLAVYAAMLSGLTACGSAGMQESYLGGAVQLNVEPRPPRPVQQLPPARTEYLCTNAYGQIVQKGPGPAYGLDCAYYRVSRDMQGNIMKIWPDTNQPNIPGQDFGPRHPYRSPFLDTPFN